MSLDYTTYVAQISNIMSVSSATSQFQTMLPGMIDYAEQRIYRELNLVSTRIINSASSLTANDRVFTLPTDQGRFVTVTAVNVITPAGTPAASGTRNVLQHMPQNFVDYIGPTNTSTSASDIPIAFYMKDQNTIIVGPAPGAAYNVEVIGTIRPTPLSSANPTTFLTLYLPDLFVAASMVFGSGYQRDFGSQADNPSQAVSWETQYEKLFASANAEELRKKYNEEAYK